MKILLFLSLAIAIARAEEPAPTIMRQRLHAIVVGSQPPSLTSSEPTESKAADDTAGPVTVMKPVVVSGSKQMPGLAAAIDRQTQNAKAERFSPTSGGTLFSAKGGKLKAGGWWTPESGWTFLKLAW